MLKKELGNEVHNKVDEIAVCIYMHACVCMYMCIHILNQSNLYYQVSLKGASVGFLL